MDYENIRFQTADGVHLHAWLVKAPKTVDHKTAPTIVFFHANAGNLGFRLPNIALLVQQLNFNVFIFDYRGYGDSDDAEINEEGLKLDGDAAAAYIASRTDIDHRKVFYFGRSLGGAVAVNTAANRPHESAGLILENTFSSVSDMVDHIFPILKHLKWLILKIQWRTIDMIPRVTAPCLFISGAKDHLVPPIMLRRLHDAAVQSPYKDLYVVEDGDHNDTFQKGGDAYVERVRGFVRRVLVDRLGAEAAATKPAQRTQGQAQGQGVEEAQEAGRQRRGSGASASRGDSEGTSTPSAAAAGVSADGETSEATVDSAADSAAGPAEAAGDAAASPAPSSDSSSSSALPIGVTPTLKAAFIS